jgi:integrase
MEDGQACRSEAAAPTEARLVDPNPASGRGKNTRLGDVQLGDRQQAARLRRGSLKIEDVTPHGLAVDRAIVRQRKTGEPVRFELTELTREAVDVHIKATGKKPGQFLFAGRRGSDQSITTRQYARLVSRWISGIGLDPSFFGTHSLRRTKGTLIYRGTGNLRAVQLLLGHTKIESTVRYLGIEVDDALTIAEQVDV